MGIYDRDYYRDQDSPWSRYGGHSATTWLVVIQCILYAIPLLNPESSKLFQMLDFRVEEILQGEIQRLVTGFFLNTGSLLVLILDMYLLYQLGHDLEDSLGTREFLLFYLATILSLGGSAVAASWIFGSKGHLAIGGSAGPIGATLLLYGLKRPDRTFLFMFVIEMSARWVAVIFGAFTIVNAIQLSSQSMQRPLLLGYLTLTAFTIAYFRSGYRIVDLLPRRLSSFRRPRLKIATLPVVNAPPKTPTSDLEKRLDEILAQVARDGKESLTPEELSILRQASEIYRRKRTGM